MISFLPTQCMIFSIRFVVQSAKDFHPCKPIQKVATSHAKQKRQGFPLYRLMFIFCQRRRHSCRMAFSLLESMHGIISLASSLSSCYISRKTKAAGLPPIPLDVYFFQCRRHDFHMAFSLLESMHGIISPSSNLSEKLLHLTQNKSGRDSTHTA